MAISVKELQDFLNDLVREHPEVMEKEVQICTVLDESLDFCEFEDADAVRFQETENPVDGKTVVLVVE